MTIKVYPTDFLHLGSVTTSFTLYADNGASNGYVTVGDVLGQLSSSNVTTALGYTPANISSPAFTGNPTVPTQSSADNSTKAANTAWVISYVQNVAFGMRTIKDACRAIATANVNISLPGAITFDGVSPSTGDRIGIINQTTASENGIYAWNGASSAMTRTADANVSADFSEGTFFWVAEGTTYADTGWILNTAGTIVLGTTSLSFTQTAGATITAGTGLVKVGSVVSLDAIANLDLLANISGSSAAPTPHTLTAYLDAVVGNTNGMLLQRLSGTWQAVTSLPFSSLPANAQNTPLSFPFSGKPGASQRIVIPLTQAWTLPANFSGTQGWADTTSTSSAVFTLGYIHGGTYASIGTVTFASATSTPTLSTQAAVNLVSGDALVLDAPSVQDATLSNVGITFNLLKT